MSKAIWKRGKAGTLLQARGQTGKKGVSSLPDSITEDITLLLQGQPQSLPLLLQAIVGLWLRGRGSRTQFQSLLKIGWPKPLWYLGSQTDRGSLQRVWPAHKGVWASNMAGRAAQHQGKQEGSSHQRAKATEMLAGKARTAGQQAKGKHRQCPATGCAMRTSVPWAIKHGETSRNSSQHQT